MEAENWLNTPNPERQDARGRGRSGKVKDCSGVETGGGNYLPVERGV